MDSEEFINMIGETARKVCIEYGLPPSVCIAQTILESGWGESCIGQYNYFGRKWNGWGNYVKMQTTEYDRATDEWYTTYAKFQSYSSLEEAIRDWCILMHDEWVYRDAINTWRETWSQFDFIDALAPVYATDPDYAQKLKLTIQANNLIERFDQNS